MSEGADTAQRGTPLEARVLFVVADALDVRRLAGTLAYLATRKVHVHVGVYDDPPGLPGLAAFSGRYPALVVDRLPVYGDVNALATTVLRGIGHEQALAPSSNGASNGATSSRLRPPPPGSPVVGLPEAPSVLVVSRLPNGAHRHYLDAARRLRIPTIFVALRPDELTADLFGSTLPDAVAVGNADQRRQATQLGIPIRHTCVIGVPLPTDILADPPAASIHRRLGLATSQRIVLYVPAHGSAASVNEEVGRWSAACAAVLGQRAQAVPAVAFMRPLPGDDVVELPAATRNCHMVRGSFDEYVAALELSDLLAHAAVVVTADADIAMEAMVRGIPTIVDEAVSNLEWHRAARAIHGWPLAVRGVRAQAEQADRVVRDGADPEGLTGLRAFLRPHGIEIEPGLLLARVVREMARKPRVGEGVTADLPEVRNTPSRRIADRRLFLVSVPSPAVLNHWVRLLEVLVKRGHRVLLLFTGGPRRVDWSTVMPLDGVAYLGEIASPEGETSTARQAAVVRLIAPAMCSDADEQLRKWHRRNTIDVPAAVVGLLQLRGQNAALKRAAHLATIVQRNLPVPDWARQLLADHAPDALVTIPDFGDDSVDVAVAQGELVRAARAGGTVVLEGSLAADDGLGWRIALDALRAGSLNRQQAIAIGDELERWVSAGMGQPRSPEVPVPSIATAAAAGLAGLSLSARAWGAIGRRLKPAGSAQRQKSPSKDDVSQSR